MKIELDIRDILAHHYKTKEAHIMSLAEDASKIGSIGEMGVEAGDLIITVEIKDAKRSYGKLRYLVTPVNGKGNKWTDSERVYIPGVDPEK